MARIEIPYSRTKMVIKVPDANLAGVFRPESVVVDSAVSEADRVDAALDAPSGGAPLEDLAVGKERVVVITSDHTRPVPSRVTMPKLLERIRRGNPTAAVAILVATGYHRATTEEELVDKFGEAVVSAERIVVHDAFDEAGLARLVDLPSGGACWINKLALEADLLIAEGFIEPHFFAGFSGGRKSVLPGIAGAATVLANHCSEFIADPNARTGNLAGNPIHRDMTFAAEKAGLAFILNVVLDEDKRIVKAFAGNPEKAHLEGCEFVKRMSGIPQCQADVVVTSNGGYPLDQNIYQTVKGMTAGEAMCRHGGTIIMISGCEDGHGGESFYRAMSEADSPESVFRDVEKVKRGDTRPDQWEYQILARVLSSHRVILVTDRCDPEMIKAMHIDHAFTFEEALTKAFAAHGKDASVAVIPDGVSVIPRMLDDSRREIHSELAQMS